MAWNVEKGKEVTSLTKLLVALYCGILLPSIWRGNLLPLERPIAPGHIPVEPRIGFLVRCGGIVALKT